MGGSAATCSGRVLARVVRRGRRLSRRGGARWCPIAVGGSPGSSPAWLPRCARGASMVPARGRGHCPHLQVLHADELVAVGDTCRDPLDPVAGAAALGAAQDRDLAAALAVARRGLPAAARTMPARPATRDGAPGAVLGLLQAPQTTRLLPRQQSGQIEAQNPRRRRRRGSACTPRPGRVRNSTPRARWVSPRLRRSW